MKIPANIIKRIEENKDWYNKSYSGYFIGICLQGEAIGGEAKVNPYAMKYGLCYNNYKIKDHFDWFWDSVELVKKRRKLIKAAMLDSSLSKKALIIGEKNHVNFVKICDEIAKGKIKIMNDRTLLKNIKDLYYGLLSINNWSYAVDVFLSDEQEDWLEALIKKELKSAATADVLAMLTLPTFQSFVNQAEVLFLQIVSSIQCNDLTKTEKLSALYSKRYYWIRSNYKEFKRVESRDILNDAKNESKILSPDSVISKIKKEKDAVVLNVKEKEFLYKKLDISKSLKSMIRTSEVMTHLQDNRKDRVLRMNTLFYELIEEVAERKAIESHLIFYFTPREVISLFEGEKIDMDVIEKRSKEGVLSIFANGTYFTIDAELYKKLSWDKNFFKDEGNVTEIKGSVAFRGIVRGVVEVLRTVEDIKKFKSGSILVANQTTPEFVPAMKKAAAIITDQGGITCHAAIISRELKLPAVIGTKIATKVLKDGDVVEVDANTGVVKIIK
ncbi:MAG: hypothetical protein JWP09_680 [Candidatus Taylorbacteria bacterium]|nr:hypothetical protein [Candidatus Taylorbacteria bacterium]